MSRLLKKDKGNLTHIFPAIITIILVAVVSVIFTSWMANINRKEAIDLIARKYILRMETTGYLVPADEDRLVTELQEAGLSEISLFGSTREAVCYGKEITLCISGNFSIYNYKILQAFALKKEQAVIPIDIKRTSTGKH